jgi:hypothetical protein
MPKWTGVGLSEIASMNTEPELMHWYILKQVSGTCAIAPQTNPDAVETWGPFTSQNEAIARRVGLIRAGKCQPA